MAAKLDGLTGGNTGSGSKNNHGIGKKQKEKPEYSTFKYSTRFTGPLHEAIMLSGGPFFLTHSSVSGHFELFRKIEEANRVLVQPYPEKYPYDLFEFNSLKELCNYEAMAWQETIHSLYEETKEVVIRYVDQDAEVINLVSDDIIWTYFQDLYPDITSKQNGIGKNTIGYVFEGGTIIFFDNSTTDR